MERRSSDQPVEQYVTDIKSTWMMEKADFALYLERCNAERIAAGLVVEHESYCPLLVAENMTIQAKHALCDAMAGVTNIPAKTAATLQAGRLPKIRRPHSEAAGAVRYQSARDQTGLKGDEHGKST